ncbi:endonuclease (plasmid) [Pedobacter sp. BS3]|uniref:endonuclease/exonuclease/phosphatase family protein n=1 Tax=Pedobacter sp. BS3 TaxID=2567937 RepID=UPI0011EE1174|nr:endonuclease/exonuclease/phosphatase family protein [Pedobacter sp. BS3]TZF86304.1 endonuclease [Pedobacter sp. BS3]
MKSLFLSVLICITASTAFCQKLVIMTYNIRHGEGIDNKVDIKRIAAVINRYHPDMVALQEVDSVTNRNGKVNQMEELGKLTGMNSCYGRNFVYDGGSYGLGILSRFPITETRQLRLPYYTDDANSPTRLLFAATLQVTPDTKLQFCTVHLDYKKASQRKIQAEALLKLIPDSIPVVLAGDFNAEPTEETLQIIRTAFEPLIPGDNTFTFPADKPGTKIDHVFLGKNFRWINRKQQVIDEEQASDHRPLLARVKLKGKK